MQYTIAFVPDQVKVVDILLIIVIEPYLAAVPVILELPIWW